MKTFNAKKDETARQWHLINAEGKTLGRMASCIATILQGKDKPVYTPHVDTGDFIVVTNAEKIILTGRKWEQKIYYHHSGYPGGLKSIIAKDLLQKRPEDIIKFAVKGMLPKSILGRQMIKKLKIYRGEKHPHQAQQPKNLEI